MRGNNTWLAEWRLHSLELFIVALSACSGLTTFLGARNLVNHSWLIAFLFTAGIQGSMFVMAHRATAPQGYGQGRRLISLYASWFLLALFSVYSSALGMFELQKDSIRGDHDRASVIQQWRAAVEDISGFRAQALTTLRARARDVSLQLTFEKNKEAAYRRSRREYSPKEKQILKSRLDALTSAEAKLAGMKPLSAIPPSDIQQARSALDVVFAEAGDAYASLPEECRSDTRAPRQTFAAVPPEDLQKAFWMELQMRSAPALFMVMIAFLLDFLPITMRYACRPRRSVAQVVRSSRLACKRAWSALRDPINPQTVPIRLVVEGYRDLDIEVAFESGESDPYLEDLKRHFDIVEQAVSEMAGERMRIAEVINSAGAPISEQVPLPEHLCEDRVICLRLEPVNAGVGI